MRRDSLDELTCAGELHRANLTPDNTFFKLASIAKEEAPAGPGGVSLRRWFGRVDPPPTHARATRTGGRWPRLTQTRSRAPLHLYDRSRFRRPATAQAVDVPE